MWTAGNSQNITNPAKRSLGSLRIWESKLFSRFTRWIMVRTIFTCKRLHAFFNPCFRYLVYRIPATCNFGLYPILPNGEYTLCAFDKICPSENSPAPVCKSVAIALGAHISITLIALLGRSCFHQHARPDKNFRQARARRRISSGRGAWRPWEESAPLGNTSNDSSSVRGCATWTQRHFQSCLRGGWLRRMSIWNFLLLDRNFAKQLKMALASCKEKLECR